MHNKLSWLNQPAPHKTLATLRKSGELVVLLPEVDALYGVPQNAEHHPEICTGIHTELCLEMAERLGLSPAARFAVLVHDLGKALTPVDELPKHIDHENRGLVPVAKVCARFSLDERTTKLALLVCEYHLHAHRTLEMRSKSLIKFLNSTGMEFDTGLFEDFVGACEADKRGRAGKAENPYRIGEVLRNAQRALAELPELEGFSLGTHEGNVRHKARLTVVRQATKEEKQGLS